MAHIDTLMRREGQNYTFTSWMFMFEGWLTFWLTNSPAVVQKTKQIPQSTTCLINCGRSVRMREVSGHVARWGECFLHPACFPFSVLLHPASWGAITTLRSTTRRVVGEGWGTEGVKSPPTAERTALSGKDLNKCTHPRRSFLAVSFGWHRARLPSFCSTMVFYSRGSVACISVAIFLSASLLSVGSDRKEVPVACECEHAGKSVSRCHNSHWMPRWL